MRKDLGTVLLVLLLAGLTASLAPNFFNSANLQNLLRWTGLFGILGGGAAFVIITGGIDLSIGSMGGLSGTILTFLIADHELSAATAMAVALGVSMLLGACHGLLVTRLKLQPFVVTLCGLLLYRGLSRWLVGDQPRGFGTGHQEFKALFAKGMPIGVVWLVALLALAVGAWLWTRGRAASFRGLRARHLGVASLVTGAGLLLAAGLGHDPMASVRSPAPFLWLLGLAVLAHVYLVHTVGGRYLFAIGRNEEAVRFSGIRTHRHIILAYVVSSGCAGLAGVMFALNTGVVSPQSQGNFYELYAIAAAVLGGCSLRGGEGSILGVVAGAALLRLLRNSINILGISTELEFAVIGLVILLGVVADELLRRFVERRQALRRLREG